MENRHRSIPQFVSYFVALALVASLVGCEFEPDIDPLILPTAPPAGFQTNPEGENEVFEPEQEAAGGGDIELSGFSSAQAIAHCGDRLTWGDENVGLCDVPGRDTFYVWTSRDQVLEVEAGNPYLVQFQIAAESRIEGEEGYKDNGIEVGLGLAGFIVELFLLAPACATLILCALDGGALTLTGVAITNSADSGVENYQTYLDSTDIASFYYCLIQGSSESFCRDTHLGGDAQ